MPHLLKTDIHLIVFDRLVYRESQLIALTLMTSSKTRAPGLRMITRDPIEMIKHHSYREQTQGTDIKADFLSWQKLLATIIFQNKSVK